MKVFVNFALVLILCFVNIASSHHAQGNAPRMEHHHVIPPSAAPIVPAAAIVVPAQASVVSAETSIVPVDIVVISTEATVTPVDNSSTTPAPAAPGYFALLLEQLKNFFVAEPTNSTVAEPSAPIVEQVVLA